MTRGARLRAQLRAAAVALALLAPAGGALAVQPDEVLDDPALEQRARALSKVIRCLVCQNESIDTSNADLARDLRILVRERLTAGDRDDQVLDYLVARYGEFVLLRPRMKPANYLLWFGPAVVLAFGGGGIALFLRRRKAASAPGELSAQERARLARLLDEGSGSE
jgi:cytochrome c-type biogenesis protein CcmH